MGPVRPLAKTTIDISGLARKQAKAINTSLGGREDCELSRMVWVLLATKSIKSVPGPIVVIVVGVLVH